MPVAGLFVAGAYAASDGDLPLAGRSQDAKQAYAAGEPGVNHHAFHVAQDPDYWTMATTVPARNPGEPTPSTTEWYGTGADTRTCDGEHSRDNRRLRDRAALREADRRACGQRRRSASRSR